MRLVIVRHSERERLCGEKEAPLTNRGQASVVQLGAFLREKGLKVRAVADVLLAISPLC